MEALRPEAANGISQREYTTKVETSLTKSLEAIMMTCAIDAKEGRYLAVTDTPALFT